MGWSIATEEDDDDGTSIIVRAPNRMTFVSWHPPEVVAAVVRELAAADALAEGTDPILPPTWPTLILEETPGRICQRCRASKRISDYALKVSGKLALTCNACACSCKPTGMNVKTCPRCETVANLRMRRGVIACLPCLDELDRPARREAAPFDIEEVVREARAGVLPASSVAASARMDLPRSSPRLPSLLGRGSGSRSN